MDGKSLRHSLRRIHKLQTPLGKKLRASNLRIWRDTTLPSTTTQETPKSRPTDAELHLARKSFRNRRKLRRNGIRRTKGTNSAETTTGLQIRPRTIEQSFRHTVGTTTEHLQPIVRNTVGCATTTVREKKVHARFRTTNERYGRHRCGTRNKTTTHHTTSTTSVNIDVKFTTTTG